MKARDLVEMLDRVEQARKEVDDAKRSIEHGGSEKTMKDKYSRLRDAKADLENLLDQDIE